MRDTILCLGQRLDRGITCFPQLTFQFLAQFEEFGVLDAARSKKIFGIGVDADQGYLGAHVMTSALKRVDVAVYTAISNAKSGTLHGGTNATFGAKVDGVGYGKWSPRVSQAIRNAVAAQYKLLKQGKIKGIPATVK